MNDIPLIDPPCQSMTLADGRTLSWQEFGVPDGRPVLYFHGGGSFSLEAGLFHREAVQRNIRLIATNRPGAGDTSLCPGRSVADYSHDLRELLDHLGIVRFACLGESNGGMVTLAVAATLADRVVGAVPINPTVPWFDPVARSVSPCAAGWGYRAMKYIPWALSPLARKAVARNHRLSSQASRDAGRFNRMHLVGPPPGIESDVGALQWRVMLASSGKKALSAELKWACADWGFDFYSIPVPLDFYCGVHDAQGPFALVLADQNPDARFHHFSYGHLAFSHPDARRRMFDTLSRYFEA
ncbi:alpha/beta fold hydrolase [Solimonas sp. SE-A11]|uniref:alpha/beta hydrolase n=1 Tax=Solimonas sp. SE-A11 TaxID=3054954 RepID=UPI00259CE41F|nr:alpha/beta hydrolase [Solimonas sp. SE-A11]MDM4769908.1 alpha/beta hydrolase [Solimonas sp. SE-A11]